MEHMTIPDTFHLIDTPDYHLLAGNDWLREANSQICWQTNEAIFDYQGRTARVPINYGQPSQSQRTPFRPETMEENLEIKKTYTIHSWAEDVEAEHFS